MAEMEREAIGRYQIQEELGRGAMGVVYRALDPVIQREVALKTIRNSDGLDERIYEELRDRFLNEARAAGRLQHRNIVAILDAGTDEGSGVSYIAMELVRGRDLDSEIHGGTRLAPDEAVAVITAVADGLAYAHELGVVHRDIKPANILRDASGGVKITDFGIARLNESSMTRTGQILGSPAYMSPEQIAGAQVDGRSDIFSLGVVLYQLLTGERPFLGEGLSTLSYQIVHTEPIPPRKINPALPAGFASVIQKALAKSSDERYQSAAELARDLRAGGVSAAPSPASTGTILDAGPGDGGATVDLGVREERAGAGGTVIGAGGTVIAAGGTAIGEISSAAAKPRATNNTRRKAARSPRRKANWWVLPAVASASAFLGVVVAAALLRGGPEGAAGTAPAAASSAPAAMESTSGPAPERAPERASVSQREPVAVTEQTSAVSGADEPLVSEARAASTALPGATTSTFDALPTAGELREQEQSQDAPAVLPAADATAQPAAGTARLFIDFEHHIEFGAVTVRLDGEPIWRSPLKARKKSRFGLPKLKLAHQDLTAELEVESGAHMVSVDVKSRKSKVDDSASLLVTLEPERTNLLKIRVSRITNKVELSDGR